MVLGNHDLPTGAPVVPENRKDNLEDILDAPDREQLLVAPLSATRPLRGRVTMVHAGIRHLDRAGHAGSRLEENALQARGARSS